MDNLLYLYLYLAVEYDCIDNVLKYLWSDIGNYYEEEKNYDEMKKYYLMAIEHNDSDAMFNLGFYYHFTKKIMMKH